MAFVVIERSRYLLSLLLICGGYAVNVAQAATVEVTEVGDESNAGCVSSGTAPCTLRDAIMYANATEAVDTIAFNIQGDGGHTIVLANSLPPITRGPLLVDGTSQVGYVSTPVITITPTSGPSFAGLQIEADDITLKALAIGGFEWTTGVTINGSRNSIVACHLGVNAEGTAALGNSVNLEIKSGGYNIIGGLGPDLRNIISGSTHSYGVLVGGTGGNFIGGNYIGTDVTGGVKIGDYYDGLHISSGADENKVVANVISGNNRVNYSNPGVNIASNNNIVEGNFIGTTADGSAALGNLSMGLVISGKNNVVGGDDIAARNVISGNGSPENQGAGIQVNNGVEIKIIGNYIGTDVSGRFAIENHDGIVVLGTSSDIFIANNLISGNAVSGITVQGNATGVVMQRNFIGSDYTGSSAIPNDYGIAFFQNTKNNLIGGLNENDGNTIAFQKKWGVALVGPGSIGIQILGNKIFSNGSPGIEFLSDAGANNNQASPVLTSVSSSSVVGQLSSTPDSTFRIEYFTTPKQPSPASAFQGKTLIGVQQVTTNASGDAALQWNGQIPAGNYVTATATNTGTSDTSRFSVPVLLSSAVEIGAVPVPALSHLALILLSLGVAAGVYRSRRT